MNIGAENIDALRERFSGFADTYDAFRPQPPDALAELLCQLAQVTRPALVADFGCGTGLSTRYWAEKAAMVIGIDPTHDMLAQARRHASLPHIWYMTGFAQQIPLPNGCADIVTCAQAFHWMDPEPTLAEAARILRRGGVFAAFDYDFPPLMHDWRANAAYDEMEACVRRIEQEHQLSPGLRFWEKSEHLARMHASGCFRHVMEVTLYQRDEGNAQRLVGLAFSQGNVQTLLKAGLSEHDFCLDHLRAVAAETLGETPRPWFWSYRMRIGVV